MKRLTPAKAAASLVAVAWLALLSNCSVKPVRTIKGEALGTFYSLVYVADHPKSPKRETIRRLLELKLHSLNAVFSTYEAHSEISRFNAHESTRPFAVSEDFFELFKRAIRISEETDGAFDMTVAPLATLWGFGSSASEAKQKPSDKEVEKTMKQVGYGLLSWHDERRWVRKSKPKVVVDMSAMAKGHIVDVLSELLERRGVSNHLLEIGGEVKVKGSKNGAEWKVGIQHPNEVFPAGYESVRLPGGHSIATSGDYENYFKEGDDVYAHIIDPKTGVPARNDMASVSVIAKSCADADAYATALMVMGRERAMSWAKRNNAKVFVVARTNGKLVSEATEGFLSHLQ